MSPDHRHSRPEVIVHHLAQARSACRAATDAGVEIQLRSAPGAAASAGIGYLQALGKDIDHELLIDCDDDAGLVMAALRTECRKLIFSGPPEVLTRLQQMAGRVGATLLAPEEDRGAIALTLSPDDDEADALRPWLASLTKRTGE